MRTLTALALVLAFSTGNAYAQCTPSVPSNAIVVNSTQTINGGFDPIWVCSDDTLHSDGGFHNIFLEPNAVMTTSGGIDTIYVKAGAKFSMNGGIHVIYFINTADIAINGGIPTLNNCSSIAFNYTNAPTNGCELVLTASFESSDTSICTGECIDFQSISSNASTWQWLFPGASPSTSTDEHPLSVCYAIAGIYDVTLIAGNGSESDTITLEGLITVEAPPATPALFQNEDTLFAAQGYASYQWYYEGVLISGATDYFYVALQNGMYSVSVTSIKGCGEASASISFVSTGALQAIHSGTSLTIYPNPADSYVNFKFSPIEISEGKISISDCFGRQINAASLRKVSGQTEIAIDVTNFPAGVYFAKIELDESHYTRVFTIVRH